MTQNEALGILVQAAQIAQAKGAFNLKEAKLISEAVDTFVPEQPVTEKATEEATEETTVENTETTATFNAEDENSAE